MQLPRNRKQERALLQRKEQPSHTYKLVHGSLVLLLGLGELLLKDLLIGASRANARRRSGLGGGSSDSSSHCVNQRVETWEEENKKDEAVAVSLRRAEWRREGRDLKVGVDRRGRRGEKKIKPKQTTHQLGTLVVEFTKVGTKKCP